MKLTERRAMKKFITTTCLALSALLILDSMNAGHALTMFYLAGEIPGTQIVLSASTMMELFALLTGFVLARISNWALLLLSTRFLVRRTI